MSDPINRLVKALGGSAVTPRPSRAADGNIVAVKLTALRIALGEMNGQNHNQMGIAETSQIWSAIKDWEKDNEKENRS